MAKWSEAAPPSRSASLKEWHLWKQAVMTESKDVFRARNSWFRYRKQEIHQYLGSEVNVPAVLHVSPPQVGESFSAALNQVQLRRPYVVAKYLLGHSTHEVKVLDLRNWPNSALDILHASEHSVSELDDWYSSSGSLLEEALCTPEEPIPLDFKVYWREGSPRVVAVVDRNAGKPKFSFLNADNGSFIPWSEIFAAGKPNDLWEPGPSPDESIISRAEKAANSARRIAELINCEDLFMGVDCYVVDDEFFLGELTPRPGAMHMPWLKREYIWKLLLD